MTYVGGECLPCHVVLAIAVHKCDEVFTRVHAHSR